MSVVLSAIDVQWPAHALALAPELERLGYRRLWTTEHHSAFQSASPAVLAAAIAARTRTLRVGAAGVMLAVHRAFAVAEDFRLLAHLFPGRVDLGVVAAVPRGPAAAALHDGRAPPPPDVYAEKLDELGRLVDDARIGPPIERAPEVWVCGTSVRSALLAAARGLAFAYHDHDRDKEGRPVDGPAVVRAYRDAFRPSSARGEPTVAVVAYGLCATREAIAREHWYPALGLPPSFLGTPARARDALLAIADRYAVSEIVVQSIAGDLEVRRASYALLAEALG